MIKVRAKIKLKKNGRKTSFKSGYRPVFKLSEKMRTSGHSLDGARAFRMGDADILGKHEGGTR
jgi:hypothetical protein